MKAKNYLSENAVKHLAGIDLSTNAEELRNTHENILEDLDHYILRFNPSHFSPMLSSVYALGVSIYSSGAVFNTKKTNAQYREAYKALVKANEFALSRELACAMNPIKGKALKVPLNEAFFESTSTRKFIHKTWLAGRWLGQTFGFDMNEFLDGIDLEPKKLSTVAVANGDAGIFSQRGSGLYSTPKRVQDGKLVSPVRHKHSELSIMQIGFGYFEFDEATLPIFNLENKGSLYIVAQNKDRYKFLIVFPDISVLSHKEKLQAISWRLYSLCNVTGIMRYLLEGSTYEGKLVIECYGITPFIHPIVVR